MDYINAFWVGGVICALVQILMEKTKMLPGRIMVLLVCTGALLGAVAIYPPFVEFAGAGASVPLLGFGNTLFKGVKEAVDEFGFIGIFMGGFKASAVGISAALVFGYLASLLFDPKMKKSNACIKASGWTHIKDIKIKTTYKRRNKDEELKKNCTLLCYDTCGIYGCCLWNE